MPVDDIPEIPICSSPNKGISRYVVNKKSILEVALFIPGIASAAVKDIHEAYGLNGDMTCGTHMVFP